MPSLEQLIAFDAAAQHRGFAGAARALGLSPSAVAKNVARLEADLGQRLFHRTTRQVTLTQDGEALHVRCQRILEELDALEGERVGAGEARGTLRLDLPITYGRQVVVPVLAQLVGRHPALRLDVRFSDRFADLVKEGLDAAVRIGPLDDSRLVARMFDQHPINTYASPAYLRRRGRPEHPDEVVAHEGLVFRNPTTGRDRPWHFRVGRRDVSVAPAARIRLGDGDALVAAAVEGLGLVQVPDYMAAEAVRRRRLVEVLAAHRPAPLAVSLVWPSQRHVPARVRLLAEALTALRMTRARARV